MGLAYARRAIEDHWRQSKARGLKPNRQVHGQDDLIQELTEVG